MALPLRRTGLVSALLGLAALSLVAFVAAGAPASAAVTLTGAWTEHPAAKVSQSSPVEVTINGHPNVIVGDSGGGLHAYDLVTGRVTWQRASGRSSIVAPLSTAGTSIFAGLSSSTAAPSAIASFRSTDGATTWAHNICAGCLQLSGYSVQGGAGASGSATSDMYGFNPANGATQWAFNNSDSTNSTPASGDLYGNRTTEFVFTNDQTGNASTRPPAQAGGHLRIVSNTGRAICSANLGGAPTHPGSFDSSPALVSYGSSEQIVFGTGASGSYPNRILVYDDACQALWVSPALAGATIGAPSVADVRGSGTPVVLEEVADAQKHPVVYEIDVRNQRILAARTLTACNNFTPGTSSSIVTADVLNKGYQDLIVPGGECGAYILDGKSLATLSTFGNNCGLQNSPLVTSDSTGRIGITIAGYQGKVGGGAYGCVEHVEVVGGALGRSGWPQFHHDGALTGNLTPAPAEHDATLAWTSLGPGHYLVSTVAGYRATVHPVLGLLMIYNSANRDIWATRGPEVAGAYLAFTGSALQIRSPAGAVIDQLWSGAASNPLLLTMQPNGQLVLTEAGSTPWSTNVVLWRA